MDNYSVLKVFTAMILVAIATVEIVQSTEDILSLIGPILETKS